MPRHSTPRYLQKAEYPDACFHVPAGVEECEPASGVTPTTHLWNGITGAFVREGGCGCEVGGEREEGVAAAGVYVENERQGKGKGQRLE